MAGPAARPHSQSQVITASRVHARAFPLRNGGGTWRRATRWRSAFSLIRMNLARSRTFSTGGRSSSEAAPENAAAFCAGAISPLARRATDGPLDAFSMTCPPGQATRRLSRELPFTIPHPRVLSVAKDRGRRRIQPLARSRRAFGGDSKTGRSGIPIKWNNVRMRSEPSERRLIRRSVVKLSRYARMLIRRPAVKLFRYARMLIRYPAVKRF